MFQRTTMLLLFTLFNLILITAASKKQGESCNNDYECGPNLVCIFHGRDYSTKKCSAKCKKSDLNKLFFGQFKIKYAHCDDEYCDINGIAIVKSCVGNHYAIYENAQPAVCSGNDTDIVRLTQDVHYRGWVIPETFTCIDLNKGDTSIDYYANMGGIILFITIATIVGLLLFLGIVYAVYYCYLNYFSNEV
jgi:hypothetical protein